MSSVREVAKRSGVSIATVSRVLNDDTANVGTETRDRVLAAVRELNYRVRPSAPSRKSATTRIIAVIVPNLATRMFSRDGNGYSSGVLDGILEEGVKHGYSTLIHIERLWPDRQAVIRRSFDGHCDGVLMVGGYEDQDTVRALWERGTPLVMVGETPNLPGISSIDITNEATAAQAAVALAAAGHRRIAYIGPDDRLNSSRERAMGVVQGARKAGLTVPALRLLTSLNVAAVKEAGGSVPPPIDAEAESSWSNLPDAATAIDIAYAPERREDWPDALVCWNALVAQEAISALTQRGLSIPRDVSLLAFDDPSFAAHLDPPLSVFAQPLYEIGSEAIHLLLERISHPEAPVRHVRLEPAFIPRATVAPRP